MYLKETDVVRRRKNTITQYDGKKLYAKKDREAFC